MDIYADYCTTKLSIKKEKKQKNAVNINKEKKENPPEEKKPSGLRASGHSPIYLIEASDSYRYNVPKRFSSLRKQFTHIAHIKAIHL